MIDKMEGGSQRDSQIRVDSKVVESLEVIDAAHMMAILAVVNSVDGKVFYPERLAFYSSQLATRELTPGVDVIFSQEK